MALFVDNPYADFAEVDDQTEQLIYAEPQGPRTLLRIGTRTISMSRREAQVLGMALLEGSAPLPGEIDVPEPPRRATPARPAGRRMPRVGLHLVGAPRPDGAA